MKKIVIVDDEPDLLQMVSLLLQINNFETFTAGSVDKALSILQISIPDLIILDVNLSGHDGREFCKELKSRKEFKHIPVILFSADSKALANFELCEANGVIEKPFEILHLISVVNNLTQSKVN